MEWFKSIFAVSAVAALVLVIGFGSAVAVEKGSSQVGSQRDCRSEFIDRDYDRSNTLSYSEFESGRYAFGGKERLGPDIAGSGFIAKQGDANKPMSVGEFCALVDGEKDGEDKSEG